MTKPLKFRKLREMKTSVGHTYEVGMFKFKYLFNNILFKLHLLKRYSYRDSKDAIIAMPYHLEDIEVNNNTFRGVVKMKLIDKSYYDIDYFYRLKRDGTKKITLSLKNVEEHKVFAESFLEDIGIKINNKWYNVESLPQLKVAVPMTGLNPIPPLNRKGKSEFIEPHFETVTYNLYPLRSLRLVTLLGDIQPSEISGAMLGYYYDYACKSMKTKLNSMTLGDLIRK